MGEPFGDVEHLLVLRRERHPHPFAEGGAAGAAVHRHVEYLAQRHPHQLALGVVFLEVQAPQHPPGGAALVVLHERLVDARRRELVDLIGLHKIAAVITKDRRLNDLYFGDLRPDKIELAHTGLTPLLPTHRGGRFTAFFYIMIQGILYPIFPEGARWKGGFASFCAACQRIAPARAGSPAGRL